MVLIVLFLIIYRCYYDKLLIILTIHYLIFIKNCVFMKINEILTQNLCVLY
jgi:hypothetical protein